MLIAVSPTERTPILVQLSLISQIGLWEKYYYYVPFDVTHYFPSNVGFTNFVLRPT